MPDEKCKSDAAAPAGKGSGIEAFSDAENDDVYEFLLTEYEKLPRRTPQFRLFVQRYLKRVTVYPKSVRFL